MQVLLLLLTKSEEPIWLLTLSCYSVCKYMTFFQYIHATLCFIPNDNTNFNKLLHLEQYIAIYWGVRDMIL